MADTHSETKDQELVALGIERAAELAYITMVRRADPNIVWESMHDWEAQPEKLRDDWRAVIRAIMYFEPKP